jgi:hypothetical protein
MDHLFLVQVQLGKPPERIAAGREAAAEGFAVDAQAPQRLDPRVRLFVRAFFVLGPEQRKQIDAAGTRAGFDVQPHQRAPPASTSSMAASTAAVSTPDRQSGVWPTQRAGGRRIRLHGLQGRSIRTT